VLHDALGGSPHAVPEPGPLWLDARIDRVQNVDHVQLHPVQIVRSGRREAGVLRRDLRLRLGGRQGAHLVGRVLPAGEHVAHVDVRHLRLGFARHALAAIRTCCHQRRHADRHQSHHRSASD
jgi:hypothetical protein